MIKAYLFDAIGEFLTVGHERDAESEGFKCF
jgi:hypothetical protein